MKKVRIIIFIMIIMFANKIYATIECENEIVENNIEVQNIVNEIENIVCSNNVLDENTIINEVSENIENEEEYENAISDEKIEDDIENGEVEINENFDFEYDEENVIDTVSTLATNAVVGNEDGFRNGFYNSEEVITTNNIYLTSTYSLNHFLKISALASNGLQLASGCNIVVENGGVLVLNAMVVDGRLFGANDGKSCITVKSGGKLMLTGHSIIDGGVKNWGINVESGGELLIESCQISYCYRGIVLQGSSYCDFASSTVANTYGNTGKSIDITYNECGIYCGGAYKGTLIVNHILRDTEKVNFEYNSYAIFTEDHSGNIQIVNARLVYNKYAIYVYGSIKIFKINCAFNVQSIVSQRGTVDFLRRKYLCK